MKLTKLLLAASIMAAATTATYAFDRQTVHALKACHDYLWNDVPAYKDLPNAAISVYPNRKDGNIIIVNWSVNWENPNISAGGNCQVIKNKVIGFEQYGKNR